MTAEVAIPKVLVVDDHHENLVAMRHILAKTGSEVVCANSGNEALKQIIREEFAVVLMDVQMPEMNGFETAEIIRNNDNTKTLPIIFVTAINKEKQYVDQGYELGAVDYLFKPVDPDILRYKVSVFMELFCQRHNYLDLAKKNQQILDSVKDGVVGVNDIGEVIFSNPAAAIMLGETRESIQGQSFTQFMDEENGPTWESTEIYRACQSGSTYRRSDIHFQNNLGDSFPVECTASTLLNGGKTEQGFVIVFNDISERIRAEQQLAQLAEYDPLTGLANRRLFYRMLPKMLAKARRLDHKVGLLFIDLDHFKSINDTLGHVVGDLLLAQVASRMKSTVRDSDTVVRLSGDEFIVILEGNLTEEGAIKTAQNLIDQMNKPFELNHHRVHTSISIGIALAPDISDDANELIKAADIAMYNAKTLGRNNYQYYDETLSQKVSFRSKVETEVVAALEREEFSVVYQPKINIASGTLKGFESLLRWNSPTLGDVSPATFIPIAEDSGRINEVGEWVLKQACLQLKEWRDKGYVDRDFSLSVNFSIKQLNNPNFLMSLEKTLKRTEVDPKHLDVEITESTLMLNSEVIIPLLRILHEMGMTISVDDFGTGYSSLNYLKMLPIDYLKIDQTFIRDIFKDNNSEIITRSIINLAHNLDLKVVAEGIETKDQEEFLRHYDCDLGQGFLYGKGQAPRELIKYFNNS